MSNMTKVPGSPDRDEVKPGMASWEGNGPKHKHCGQCKHREYYHDQDFFRGCFMFFKLSGVHGPRIQLHWKACKYFEEKPK
jgi:hypothetical protein